MARQGRISRRMDRNILGILETVGVKHEEMKGQINEEYIRRVKNTLKSKLNEGNIILAINSRPVTIVRYGTGILILTKTELKELDWKTRKLMKMMGHSTLKQMLVECICRDVMKEETL